MKPQLNRREVVKSLLHNRGDLILVTGLGAASWDSAAAGDHALSFPLWGGMGGAVMVGLGLALAQPSRRVLVITGDGEALMGIGAFATTAKCNTSNLSIVVLDNELYGETGRQQTHTAFKTDLAAVALACGFPSASTIRTQPDVDSLRNHVHESKALSLTVVKVALTDDPAALPPREGSFLKNRMREALVGPGAILE